MVLLLTKKIYQNTPYIPSLLIYVALSFIFRFVATMNTNITSETRFIFLLNLFILSQLYQLILWDKKV